MAERVYGFVLEGENVDGDLLSFEFEYENFENFLDACNAVENDAVNILENENGGHIDIFDMNGKFITDVEV